MYNINNPEFDRIYPNEKALLQEVTDYEIYRYYVGDFQVGKPMLSPLIKDTKPSFAIFPSRKYSNTLLFKDHRGLEGGCIKFIKLLFNCSYKEALERIVIDFKLEDKFIVEDKSLKQLKPVQFRLDKESRIEFEASKLDIQIKSRKWENHDIRFWKEFGISLTTLELFNVIPIKYYWMYGKLYNADKYAYAYKEYKDGILNYKIYQPFRDTHNHKFLNGFLDGTFSGWGLLPKYTDLIIIAKSTKDCMFLHEHSYYSVSPQGEGYIFKPQVIDILKSKCNRLIQFYDHDFAGIKSAERNRKEFGLEYVTTCDFEAKDPTDYNKKYGLNETLKLLKILFK